MPRELPVHPHLDHLKHQARRLLREVRRERPSATLADAQHAIAREYGFMSWPKLKIHVETVAQPARTFEQPATASSDSAHAGGGDGGAVGNAAGGAPDYGFERYTPSARQALFFSRYEASQAGSLSIEPEHVLLGLMRAAHGVNHEIFDRGREVADRIREDIRLDITRKALPNSVEIPFSAASRHVLLAAAKEADRLAHRRVGIAHLIVGLLQDADSATAATLRLGGVDLQNVRDELFARRQDEDASA